MLSVQELGYEVGGRWLFTDVTWTLSPGQRIGLVGRNGTGKSTLLRILNGDVTPTEGLINRQRDLKIGFLTQDLLEFESHESIARVCMGAFVEELALQRRIDELLAADEDTQCTPEWLEELGDAQERFQQLGGYEMEARVGEVLSGLGFAPNRHNQPYATFSGGWRMRVMLAKILLAQPHVLLLDEPTNHLDLPAIEWLENYLQKFSGTSITISHDRDFLDRMVNQVVEISAKRLHFYTGNYTKYLEERAERRTLYQAAYENQQKKISDTEDFINRFKAKASKASQAQSRVKQLERMEKLEPLEAEASDIAFRFKLAEQPGRDILHLNNIGKKYGEIELLRGAECHLFRGDKVGLVGANGTGKSTLLRLLAGVEKGTGTREEGIRTRISMFAQHQLEDLNPQNSILEELAAYGREFGETYLRSVLGGFMFSGDEVTKQIQVLSGGERARVALAKALLSEANVLMLDEPTNHLDIPSIEVLIRALQNYQGTFVVISHNRHFLRNVTNKTWTIEDQLIKEYPGTYEEYEYYRAQKAKAAPAPTPAPKAEAPKPEPKPEPKPSRPPGRDNRALQNRLKTLENEIAKLETQRDQLKAKLADPAMASDFQKLASVQVEIDTISSQIDTRMDEWATVSEELETA